MQHPSICGAAVAAAATVVGSGGDQAGGRQRSADYNGMPPNQSEIQKKASTQPGWFAINVMMMMMMLMIGVLGRKHLMCKVY